MNYLDDLQNRCYLLDWEDSDDMCISVVGTIGNVRRMLKVAREAEKLWRELKGSTPADIVGNGGAEMIEDLGKALKALEAGE